MNKRGKPLLAIDKEKGKSSPLKNLPEKKVSRKDFLKTLVATPLVIGGLSQTAHALTNRDAKKEAKYLGYLYDSTKCQGCRACVMACAQANDMPQITPEVARDNSGMSRTAIRMAQDGKDTLVKSNCMHCLHPSCVSACPVSAMIKDPVTGIVHNDTSKCIGCRYCMIACPFNMVKFEWHKALPHIVKCDMCFNTTLPKTGTTSCVSACPTGALKFGKREELLEEAKKRIADTPKKYNPKVYGEYDGGGTSILYLTDTTFEALGFPARLGTESPAMLSETLQSTYKGLIAPIAGMSVISFVVYHNFRKSEQQEGDK